MKLHVIEAGTLKLDGGAMFGVVPKTLWSKQYPPDENNLCTWTMRCLLVETEDRLILIDNGMGSKQSDKFFSHYQPQGDGIVQALRKKGFEPEDITDNFLTHLHFDHCGGGVQWNANRTGYELTFPNATYWSHKKQWEHAMNPNAREKASFLKENLKPMKESGQLSLLDGVEELLPSFTYRLVHGHTESQMLPQLIYNGRTLIYMADLLPSHVHVPLPWVMAYDIRPLETFKEKEVFLTEAAEKEYILFFEHDNTTECCTLEQTEKGVRVKEKFKLADIS